MSAAAKLQHIWRAAFLGMRKSPFVHFIAVLALGLALFSAGLGHLALAALEKGLGALGEQVELTVYAKPTTSSDALAQLQKQVAARAGGEARIVTREVALERLVRDLGPAGESLANLSLNPLPPSIEVTVGSQKKSPAEMKALAVEFQKLPDVEAVDYAEVALERLGGWSKLLRWSASLAFLLGGIAVVVIVSATLQLAIYARREEIEIQKLVGGTDFFVRAPFLIEGTMQGLLGAALALVGLLLLRAAGYSRGAELLTFLAGPRALSLPTPWEQLPYLILAGCSLGLVGSLVAVGRFLKI